ncbi:MAG: hypothetical protein AAB037_01260 [Chloroflexota bacterium]
MAGRQVGSRDGGRRWLSTAGAVSFLAGYTISIIAGLWWPTSGGVIGLLSVLGVVVGLLNITGKEIIPYLVAAIALVLIGNIGAFSPLNQVIFGLGDSLNDIVRLMAIFTAPAAVIQAGRAGIVLAKPGE